MKRAFVCILGSLFLHFLSHFIDNATIQAATDRMVCPGNNLAHAIANASTFPAFYVYHNHRAYGLNYLNPYGLCSFPVGHPQPYYRCHSGDLYEVR